MIGSDVAFFRKEIDLLPDHAPARLISEFVQNRRIMPADTPFPGYWDNMRTPYGIEIQDDMSPFSPIQHSITMKARKLGVTAFAENVIGYWNFENPTSCEYVTATDDLAENWSTRRYDAMVNSMGFRNLVASQINQAKSRRTGDKVFKKEFVGGYLDIISSSSKTALRAGDIRVLVRDEIDGRPPRLPSGEGYWTDVNFGHTASWGPRKKVMDFSSPTTTQDSEINRLYLTGDCRKFIVECPHCHRGQELVHLEDDAKHGIKPIIRAGEFEKAIYVCEFCYAEIENHQKTEILKTGHWEPTRKSSDPTVRSRQISSLYSPVGMLSWSDYWRLYIKSIDDSEGARAFTNIYRGLPYAETGARPDLRKVILLRGEYRQREVQRGVVYLTAAIDVQRGQDEAQPEKIDGLPEPERSERALLGPRLEMEILGHGRGYKTWSVDYRVFTGSIRDPYAGAWEKLNEWASDGGLLYKRNDGLQFTPMLVLVDSSDGNVTDIVYAFCARWSSTHPCKGQKIIKADPDRRERGDIAGTAYKRWRTLQIGDVTQVLYEVNTQFYKQQLYAKLNTVMRRPVDPQPNGFQDFPRDYSDRYFSQLTAEDQMTDGSFQAHGRRNEALDCRVYNMAAGDIYLMGVIEWMRRHARENGMPARQTESIGSVQALDYLERKIESRR